MTMTILIKKRKKKILSFFMYEKNYCIMQNYSMQNNKYSLAFYIVNHLLIFFISSYIEVLAYLNLLKIKPLKIQ